MKSRSRRYDVPGHRMGARALSRSRRLRRPLLQGRRALRPSVGATLRPEQRPGDNLTGASAGDPVRCPQTLTETGQAMKILLIYLILMPGDRWEFLIAEPSESPTFCATESAQIDRAFTNTVGNMKVLCAEDRRIWI